MKSSSEPSGDTPYTGSVLERLLERVAHFAQTRPRTILAIGMLSTLVSVYAFMVPVDLSFSSVMNRGHPEVARYFAASQKYGLGGLLLLPVEGPEERLDEAATEVRRALDELEEVRSVFSTVPRDWLLARAPWLVDGDVFDAWVALSKGSEDLAGSRAIERASVLDSDLLPSLESTL